MKFVSKILNFFKRKKEIKQSIIYDKFILLASVASKADVFELFNSLLALEYHVYPISSTGIYMDGYYPYCLFQIYAINKSINHISQDVFKIIKSKDMLINCLSLFENKGQYMYNMGSNIKIDTLFPPSSLKKEDMN